MHGIIATRTIRLYATPLTGVWPVVAFAGIIAGKGKFYIVPSGKVNHAAAPHIVGIPIADTGAGIGVVLQLLEFLFGQPISQPRVGTAFLLGSQRNPTLPFGVFQFKDHPSPAGIAVYQQTDVRGFSLDGYRLL